MKESKGNVEHAIIIAESLHAKEVLGRIWLHNTLLMDARLVGTCFADLKRYLIGFESNTGDLRESEGKFCQLHMSMNSCRDYKDSTAPHKIIVLKHKG